MIFSTNLVTIDNFNNAVLGARKEIQVITKISEKLAGT